ncbi:6-phospho-beta-glucosidase [Enorma massiliensis]|uniref:6-phospho-beta-glucosidase n=1 Tax=Enorma massiliensis TaxID=1472761 RepID=UPI0002E5A19C|nr:6-phospho-beta-glucosidase [Enorma massiliensis]
MVVDKIIWLDVEVTRDIWLVDVPEGEEKLQTVGGLARRMVEAAGIPMDVHLALDRREAFAGADFVTTQFRVGQLDARIADERIALKHGLIGQETNGAGGMFKALRTIPVIFDIIRDMEEICPNALLINFTNPVGIVSEAVMRYTSWQRYVGLCNCPISMRFGIARWMGIDPARVRMELSGLNHHFFVTDVFIDGKSCFDEVLDRYCELPVEELGTMKNIMAIPWSSALVRGLRAVPVSYLNYYFSTREGLAQLMADYRAHGVRAEVVKQVEAELFELYRDPELHEKPKRLEERGGAHYSDAACSLIDSIVNDRGDIQYVDVRNGGAVSSLPAESTIECAAMITADGPKPLTVGELSPAINGTIQTVKSFERLVAEAAVTGNRDLLVAALVANPLCDSDAAANAVIDGLLEAHKAYLPQFFGQKFGA